MATNYPKTQVNDFLERSIHQQEQAVQTSKLLYKKMIELEQRFEEKVETVQTDMDKNVVKVERLHKQINDDNRLLPAEIDDMYEAARQRAAQLAKMYHPELDGHEFRKECGKMQTRIWRRLKKKFGTSKYIHTKRKDYKAAMYFINTFDPKDYI